MLDICRLLTAELRVRSQYNPRLIFSGLSGKATGSSPNTVGFLCDFSPHKRL